MAEQLPSDTGDAETTGSLCAGAAVNIVGGTYKGRTGHAVKVMNKKVEVQLDDGKKVQLMQTSVKPRESEPQASAEASTEEPGPETPVTGGRGLFTGYSHSSEGTARLQPKTHVMTNRHHQQRHRKNVSRRAGLLGKDVCEASFRHCLRPWPSWPW